ncbi:hypothetical protein VW35_00820 [Devosia soli]|uniref:Head morphogenesis protein n=1 Tax=Devosia soli TaxID=361041 RepID=A0A0F5LF11_9HYPH|nr:hypothetical protein [Devosia soli]KKB80784.1 hypothetical protein VW35_00820 [Devosia soli]
MASNRTPFDQLVDKFSPEVRAAFLEAYDRIKAGVTPAMLKRIVAEIDRGNIEAAIDLLGIDRAAFGGLDLAIADAFNRGGIAMAADVIVRDPAGTRVALSFGVRNLIAEALLRDLSAQLVTRETEQAKQLLRIALTEGLARGDNPTKTALEAVGRVNRATGKREGGYIGLSGPQERTQAKARSSLISGDPEGMRDYLQLKQRDKRFDRMVAKAISEGKALFRQDVDRIVGRLNDKQLKFRADVIALNETRAALAMAKNEGIRQGIESGKIDPRDVTKTWGRTISEHPRSQHKAMVGQTVPYDQPFVAPDGTLIPYPHAPGLPARHTVGCNCPVTYKIDYTAALIRRRQLA